MRAILLLLASCATDPAPADGCRRILDAYCDALKECGGDVAACLVRRDEVCAGATAAPSTEQIDQCAAAMGPHTCALGAPVFSAAAAACLAMFGCAA